MAVQNIIFLVIVAATFPAYSKHLSLRIDNLDDSAEKDVHTKDYKVCETDECKNVAEDFLASMNKSVNPCDDFYEFACGGWAAKDPIPPSEAYWSRYQIVQNTINYRIKGILEAEPDSNDLLPVRQAKQWYRSCMNTGQLFIKARFPKSQLISNQDMRLAQQIAGGVNSSDTRFCICSTITRDIPKYSPDTLLSKPNRQFTGKALVLIAEYLEEIGVKPISSIAMQAGGWPITMDEGKWDSERYPWQKVERHYARLTGACTLYNMEKYHPLVELWIDEPNLPLVDNFGLGSRINSRNIYDVYVRLVEDAANLVAQHNRTDASKVRVSREAKEIVDFEKEIYELKQIGENYESMTFDQFIDWYETNMTEVTTDPKAKIEWRSMMQVFLEMANIDVNTSEKIVYFDFTYIKGICELLKTTPSRTIVNYIHWNFVAKMLPFTIERATDGLFELKKENYGVKERAPRWSKCVKDMKMSDAAAFAFITKYFTKPIEMAALEMIKNIEIGMEHQIEKSNWLNVPSKEWAKDKLKNMQMSIRFPDWYKNNTAFIDYYKGLTIGTGYFDNSLSWIGYEGKKKWENFADNIFSNTVNSQSGFDVIMITGHYSFGRNRLSVAIADFLPPLFSPQFPDIVNYATAGHIVGHEMGHAFDVFGIDFAKKTGAAKLPKDVLDQYYENVKCFIDQFARYFKVYFGKNSSEFHENSADAQEILMATRTQRENIADSTGMQSVFEAYKNVSKKSSRSETRLPGLEEFTEDQLFFLSFGTMLCEVQRPEFPKKQVKTNDMHSPSKFRLIGTVSNTKDFAKAFNCPTGSPMNPRNKCNIWDMPGSTMKTINHTVVASVN